MGMSLIPVLFGVSFAQSGRDSRTGTITGHVTVGEGLAGNTGNSGTSTSPVRPDQPVVQASEESWIVHLILRTFWLLGLGRCNRARSDSE